MCEGTAKPYGTSTETPEAKLTKLMRRELDVYVSEQMLRLFIKAHWSKVSKLAHEIHDKD